jgi:carbamoyltransferase
MSTTPTVESDAHVLGWHDSHGASAAVLSRSGRILYAASEERFTKQKLQKGHPAQTLADIASRFDRKPVSTCYTDMPLMAKSARNASLVWNSWRNNRSTYKTARSLAGTILGRVATRRFDGVAGTSGPDQHLSYDGLCEHHTAHAASAYYPSGFQKATIVTVDGVGDCLSAAVFEADRGLLKLRRTFFYNEFTVGADYEMFTAMLGFNPDRHCGKITGLAAYGKYDESCVRALESFFRESWRAGDLNYFDRCHGPDADAALVALRRQRESRFSAFSREDLAHAMQHIAEQRVVTMIRENVRDIAGANIALAGGVFANVRINQKIKELGFANIFVQPAMDDGGLALGAAYHHLSRTEGVSPHRLPHMFVGPGYGEDEMRDALDRAGADYKRVDDIATAIARLLADGKVVGRFDGCMEFGPRALGNRSILYDTRDPSVNAWLNKRLQRTDFMPFAPVTLIDEADRCYSGLDGCRHTAEFMTITFDCTEYMRRTSPAVVHVDGTARAQLVTPESNRGLHDILEAYRDITGIPSLVNTSFNMHESPIVNSPTDAVTTFQEGRLDYLAIGPFLAKHDGDESTVSIGRRHEMQAELSS